MTVVVSIITGFIAAFVAHFLATRRIRENELLKYQLASYSEFLGSAARLSVARRLGDVSDDVDELSKLNDAKNRILICGNKAVVSSLLEFWKQGATLEGERELLAFKKLSTEMRCSIGHKKYDLFDLEISNAMFKLEPSSFSYRAKNKIEK